MSLKSFFPLVLHTKVSIFIKWEEIGYWACLKKKILYSEVVQIKSTVIKWAWLYIRWCIYTTWRDAVKSQSNNYQVWECKVSRVDVSLILKAATKAELEASCLHEISYIFNVYDGLNFSWILKSADCYETIFASLFPSKLITNCGSCSWWSTHTLQTWAGLCLDPSGEWLKRISFEYANLYTNCSLFHWCVL